MKRDRAKSIETGTSGKVQRKLAASIQKFSSSGVNQEILNSVCFKNGSCMCELLSTREVCLNLKVLMTVAHKAQNTHDWLQLPKLQNCKKKAHAHHNAHCLHKWSEQTAYFFLQNSRNATHSYISWTFQEFNSQLALHQEPLKTIGPSGNVHGLSNSYLN